MVEKIEILQEKLEQLEQKNNKIYKLVMIYWKKVWRLKNL